MGTTVLTGKSTLPIEYLTIWVKWFTHIFPLPTPRQNEDKPMLDDSLFPQGDNNAERNYMIIPMT